MSTTALSTAGRFPVRRKRPNRPPVDNASRLVASVVRGPVHVDTPVPADAFLHHLQTISEAFLIPVLNALLASFPFPILGFHVDNGSEYI